MAVSRKIRSDAELQDMEISRLIKAKLGVLTANWKARQEAAIIPRVLQLADELRDDEEAPRLIDYNALVDQVWNERLGKLLESEV